MSTRTDSGGHDPVIESRDQLIAAVQGEGVSVVDRAIDTHVFGLRKKLGECAAVIEGLAASKPAMRGKRATGR